MRKDGEKTFVVSEKNLRALLVKLEGYPEKSACTIEAPDGSFFLKAEPDEVHYVDRAAGIMHPTTEKRLNEQDGNN